MDKRHRIISNGFIIKLREQSGPFNSHATQQKKGGRNITEKPQNPLQHSEVTGKITVGRVLCMSVAHMHMYICNYLMRNTAELADF